MLYTVLLDPSPPKTLVKTLVKNLTKNLVKNLAKNLVKNLAKIWPKTRARRPCIKNLTVDGRKSSPQKDQ